MPLLSIGEIEMKSPKFRIEPIDSKGFERLKAHLSI